MTLVTAQGARARVQTIKNVPSLADLHPPESADQPNRALRGTAGSKQPKPGPTKGAADSDEDQGVFV